MAKILGVAGMEYEVVIGLEVHSQLLAESKMFCACSSAYQDQPPNTVVCPVCMGMPGVLPVINRRAVEYVIKTGLALSCKISEYTKFDRKNYPYPDLMKGYQISQYDRPIAYDGFLTVDTESGERRIGVTRVHLEEDVAKLTHVDGAGGEGYSLLDVNRAGVSLMETVSEPDMRSAEEARSYLMQLHSILQYLGVSTANMEEGSFRCDANISVRPEGTTDLGAKVEVKNMNSFRGVFRALEYEAERQKGAASRGEVIAQETRGWHEADGRTFSQRSKEYAHDYRYFPEPDLPPLTISPAWVGQITHDLPELPRARMMRFMESYGLTAYDAGLLTASKSAADYFESVLQVAGATGDARTALAKSVGNWMLGEAARLLNLSGGDFADLKIAPDDILGLLAMIESGKLSTSMAKTVFEEMFSTGRPPDEIAEASGMVQISDEDSIRAAVEEAVTGNPKPVADYLNGKETAMRFLVGQVMRITKGKANPQVVPDLLTEKLESLR